MYGQLGSIVWRGINSPNAFRITEAPTFSEQALINGKPRLQATGDELSRVAISIQLGSGWTNPQADYEQLRASMQNKEVLPLVMGDGTFLGNYVIENLNLDRKTDDANGRILLAELSINLMESATGDPLADAAVQAIKAGIALAANKPQRITRTPFPISDSGKLAVELTTARTKMSAVEQAVTQAQREPTKAEQLLRRAERAARAARAAAQRAERVMLQAQRLQTLAQSGVAQIRQAERNMAALTEALTPPVDIQDAVNATRRAQFATTNMITVTSPIASAGAARRL